MRLLLAIALSLPLAAAAEPTRKPIAEVELNDIVAETQRIAYSSGEAGNGLHMAWWIPPEYWDAALNNDGTVSGEMREQLMAVLRDYTMFAIVQADVSAFGAFDFYDQEQVEKYLDLRYRPASGVSSTVQFMDKLPADLTLLQSQLRPILAAAMGNLGSNFHFFTATNRVGDDQRLSPFDSGRIEIRMATRKGIALEPIVFEAPLDSLHVPRRCPNGKPAHISWAYCPWSGKKL